MVERSVRIREVMSSNLTVSTTRQRLEAVLRFRPFLLQKSSIHGPEKPKAFTPAGEGLITGFLPEKIEIPFGFLGMEVSEMKNPTKSAFILIDMEQGFIDPASAHCIKGAAATVPTCEKAIQMSRQKGIPIFFVKRIYRENGSDVECTRYQSWIAGGRSMAPGSYGAQEPESLRPQPGDYTIIKPRWSAFFQTELDLILRRLGIRTVILAGTTTPNCIRTTCYDANALDYNVVILSDCTSSQTEEIQQANLADMERMGALVINTCEFEHYGEKTVLDLAASIRSDIEKR